MTNRRPMIAIGPEMPGWGSWDWVGADLASALVDRFQFVVWRDEIPACDLLLVIKHALSVNVVDEVARQVPIVYLPVDYYGSTAHIDADRAMLRRCARIIVHCHRLRRYFEPYAPTEYLDHHVKFQASRHRPHQTDGFLLWIGVRSNLEPIVEWLNADRISGEIRVLTNHEEPADEPDPTCLGIRRGNVRVGRWTPALHADWTAKARAAFDIKGTDFRSTHKPSAKAIDFIASGLPLAMNRDSSSTEHLAALGFEIASIDDQKRWFSAEYAEETARFGTALREILSLPRIANRAGRILDAVLAESMTRPQELNRVQHGKAIKSRT